MKKLWWAVTVVLVMALGLWAFYPRPQARVAIVRQGGIEVDRISLVGLFEPLKKNYQAPEGGTNEVQFSREGVQVVRADCPDQICVQAGLLAKSGQSAACLPHQWSVTLEGGEVEADAVVW